MVMFLLPLVFLDLIVDVVSELRDSKGHLLSMTNVDSGITLLKFFTAAPVKIDGNLVILSI